MAVVAPTGGDLGVTAGDLLAAAAEARRRGRLAKRRWTAAVCVRLGCLESRARDGGGHGRGGSSPRLSLGGALALSATPGAIRCWRHPVCQRARSRGGVTRAPGEGGTAYQVK